MKIIKLTKLLISALTLCLTACGSDDSFTVLATVDGLGTQNVRAVYRSAGRVNVLPSMALDGKFQFSGNAPQPALIELYTGSLVVRNGETVEVTYKLNEPGTMSAKGSKISEQIARFRTANAEALNSGNIEAVNKAVEQYVSGNRDNAAAPYIVLTMYDQALDPVMADSLLSMIDPKVRPAGDLVSSYRESLALGLDTLSVFSPLELYTTGDSVTTVAPRGARGVLLAFSALNADEPHDSLVRRLNAVHDSLKKRVRVVELSIVGDTGVWNAQIDSIKPRYTRCWEPGGISSPALGRIAVRRLPWYVAADSTGAIVYAGDELAGAVEKL